MPELQPRTVSRVSNPDSQYLVIPAIGEEPLAGGGDKPIGRVFIHQLKAPRGLGDYQEPPERAETPLGTLYIELDEKQFKQAVRLLAGPPDQPPQLLRWQLDPNDAIASLNIGETEFLGSRQSDTRQLKTA